MSKKRSMKNWKRQTATTSFIPITMESLGFPEQPDVQLSANQSLYLEAFLEVEQEQMKVDLLHEMPAINNPVKHKELLAQHTALLQAAKARLASYSFREE